MRNCLPRICCSSMFTCKPLDFACSKLIDFPNEMRTSPGVEIERKQQENRSSSHHELISKQIWSSIWECQKNMKLTTANAGKRWLTRICLKSGKLLHHFTILYKRWSATLHKLAIKSGLESSPLARPALASSGFVASVADVVLLLLAQAASTGPLPLLPVFELFSFARLNSDSLYFHKCSTSIISCNANGRFIHCLLPIIWSLNIEQHLLTCNNVGMLCRLFCAFAVAFSIWFGAFVRLFEMSNVPSTSDGLSIGNVYEHWYVDRPPRVRSSRIASNFMPRCKHFSKRHAGHFLRVAIVIGQGPPRKHT